MEQSTNQALFVKLFFLSVKGGNKEGWGFACDMSILGWLSRKNFGLSSIFPGDLVGRAWLGDWECALFPEVRHLDLAGVYWLHCLNSFMRQCWYCLMGGKRHLSCPSFGLPAYQLFHLYSLGLCFLSFQNVLNAPCYLLVFRDLWVCLVYMLNVEYILLISLCLFDYYSSCQNWQGMRKVVGINLCWHREVSFLSTLFASLICDAGVGRILKFWELFFFPSAFTLTWK